MGSYDFGSWEVHFYSHNLWSSPWCALKTFLHVCAPLWLTNLFIWVVSLPTTEILFGDTSSALRAVLFNCQWEWVPLALHSARDPGPDIFGIVLHSLWTSQEKGAGPVKTFTNSFTDHLDTHTVFPLSVLLDCRARSHTRTEGMGYKSKPPI